MRFLKWLVRGLVALALLAALGVAGCSGPKAGCAGRSARARRPRARRAARHADRHDLVRARRLPGQRGAQGRLRFEPPRALADTISVEFVRIESLVVRKPETKKTSEPSTPFPFRIRVADAQVKSPVFEGYEIHDSRRVFRERLRPRSASRFSGAGARASMKASINGETISVESEVKG